MTKAEPRALPGNRRALTREPVQGGTVPTPWLYERGVCVRIGILHIWLS